MYKEIPEARSGVVFICPDCGKMFKTKIDYENHYKEIHTKYMKMKEYVGKWFVYYFTFDSINYPRDILFPTYVDEKGHIFAKVWNIHVNGCDKGTTDIHYLEKEITKEEAKKIIEGWHEKNIIDWENEYQKDLKRMFDEEAKE